LNEALTALSEQALKAINGLYSIFSRVQFDVKTKLLLFDRMVSPIVLYCSEVLGIYNTNIIERVHIKYCKKILGVKTQTPNIAVLGELGRFPLTLISKERVIKYWLKIVSNPQSIMFNIFQDQCNNLNRPRNSNWAHEVKCILDELGYSYLWNNTNPNINYFPQIQKRLRDQYQQTWYASINEMSKLDYYVRYKKSLNTNVILILLKMIILESCLPALDYHPIA
jgi:hypothetical protein